MFYAHFFLRELRIERQFQFYTLNQGDMHEDQFINKVIVIDREQLPPPSDNEGTTTVDDSGPHL